MWMLQDCRWKDGVSSKKPLHAKANVVDVIQASLGLTGLREEGPAQEEDAKSAQPARLYLTDCSLDNYKQRGVHPDTLGVSRQQAAQFTSWVIVHPESWHCQAPLWIALQQQACRVHVETCQTHPVWVASEASSGFQSGSVLNAVVQCIV